jgi:phosphoglycolate phosphatase
VRGVAQVVASEHRVRQPADGDRGPAASELLEKRHRNTYFGLSWASVRAWLPRPVWMRRDDVPEQHVLLEPKFAEHTVDDRRRRLGRPDAADLTLGRERQAADPRPAIARGFADEEITRVPPPVEIGREPLPAELGLGVLVAGVADSKRREPLDQAPFHALILRRYSRWQVEKPLAILFDIDGTLISSGGAGAESWRRAFNELYGIPADIGEFTDAGMTDPEVGRLTFVNVIGREPTAEEMATLMARRQAALPAAVAESKGYEVLPGVEATLKRLSDAGFLLGLTTGGTEAAGHTKLERGGLNPFFSFGGYGSDSSDRTVLTRRAIERAGEILKRPVDPKRVLVVGDTPFDIDAAHAAGAVAVGVATGRHSEDDLRRAGADYVLGTLEEELPGVAAAPTR